MARLPDFRSHSKSRPFDPHCILKVLVKLTFPSLFASCCLALVPFDDVTSNMIESAVDFNDSHGDVSSVTSRPTSTGDARLDALIENNVASIVSRPLEPSLKKNVI